MRKYLSRWREARRGLVKIVECSRWYNCMIYGRNYLTSLQSAARLQQYYCRPADRKYEGLTGERGDWLVRWVYLLCLMRDISPDHYSLITAREVSSLETRHIPICYYYPPRLSSHYSSTSDWHSESESALHPAEWKTMLAREETRWSQSQRETRMRCHDVGREVEVRSDVPWPHSSYCVTH